MLGRCPKYDSCRTLRAENKKKDDHDDDDDNDDDDDASYPRTLP